ncbi:MAG: DIP1984 family protein [Helicobacteraceae bacterium]|nr:DIP1984 family protein [Helicobacteraceae bacterium]
MKLAEALLLRSEYNNKIESLQERIKANVKVQEGDAPFEDPQALAEELFAVYESLYALIKKINLRNGATTLSSGVILSEALINREALIAKRRFIESVVEEATQRDYRSRSSEIKTKVVLSVKELQKQIDTLSKSFRELDTQIQSANWTTDLE